MTPKVYGVRKKNLAIGKENVAKVISKAFGTKLLNAGTLLLWIGRRFMITSLDSKEVERVGLIISSS